MSLVRRGFSLIEVTVSTLLVGVLLAAALSATGQSLLGQRKTADREVARLLADTLLAEILLQNYSEPGEADPPCGPDAGETSANRTTFDDVDDYCGAVDSPPTTEDGTAIPGLTGWERQVTSDYVDSETLAVVGSDEGAKRITVEVRLEGETIYTAVGYATNVP
jgi:prepilin-type N-terminal cleavage/methylation domain-containing protein